MRRCRSRAGRAQLAASPRRSGPARPACAVTRSRQTSTRTGTDSVLRAIFDQLNLAVPVRDRLDLQGRRPGDAAFGDFVGPVQPGGTVQFRVQLAGDDVAGVPITFTHDANGSVPASATTDATGAALVTYTAPSAPQIELVTAELTEAGLTSADGILITTAAPGHRHRQPGHRHARARQTQQFTATVTGPASGVTWSATGGTITTTGLYTAGSTARQLLRHRAHVVARSSSSAARPSTIAAPASVEGRLHRRALRQGVLPPRRSPASRTCRSHTSAPSQSFVSSRADVRLVRFQGGVCRRCRTWPPSARSRPTARRPAARSSASITWCRFAPLTDRSGSTRLNGSIGNGLLGSRLPPTTR